MQCSAEVSSDETGDVTLPDRELEEQIDNDDIVNKITLISLPRSVNNLNYQVEQTVILAASRVLSSPITASIEIN